MVQIDIVTIFPRYFDVLGLSLIGKAAESGLAKIFVHDLRDEAPGNHRVVDDSPFGGGPGMVMTPEPWGRTLDQILSPESLLVVPSPAGQTFSAGLAKKLARVEHLVFACGRYEGIDQRVVDYYQKKGRVLELSIGNYVLNGGEIAALAIIEATMRFLPGFLGNPNSLTEESHENGRLEYPTYTKPRSWRGMEVPEVLLRGNHKEIQDWRDEQSLKRTVRRRAQVLDD